MILTRLERMALANQHRLLELLDVEHADYWRQRCEVFERGYEAHYDDDLRIDPTELTATQSDEVLEILSLFTALAWSHADLGDTAGIDAARIRFPGFSRNTETAEHGYVEFTFHRGPGRAFEPLQEQGDGRSVTSLCPMLPVYRLMLQAWRAMGSPQQRMSAARIQALLDVMTGEQLDESESARQEGPRT